MAHNSSGLRFAWIEKAILLIAISVLLWLAIAAWFNPFRFQVFAGDDLAAFSANQASSSPPIRSFGLLYHKFRPVALTVTFLISKWTNCDLRSVASITVAIHTANALLFFTLLYRKIRLPLALTAGLTLIATFNRFATYLLMQDEAIMEGVGIVLLLLLLIASLSFLERPATGRALVILGLFALLVYLHERYLALALPLFLLAASHFKDKRRLAIVLGVGVILTSLSYPAIKKLWFDAPFLVGTGGSSIDFGLRQIATFVWRGALNLIGINRGPSYLSLEDFSDSPGYVRFLSVTAAILSLGLVTRAFWAARALRTWNEDRLIILQLAFFLSTAAVLLLSASITIRQEYRWLYPAFLVFLALLASTPGIVIRGRTWVQIALAGLVVVSLGREIYLVRRLPNFFAFGAYQTANNFVETLSHVGRSIRYESILIRGDVPSKDWVFLEGTFSRFYHLPPLEFQARNSTMGQTDQSRLVLDYDETDRSFKIANSDAANSAPFHRMNYTVLEQSSAALTPDNRLATPTKTAIFALTKNGVNCMAVVAPVDVDLPVPRGASLLHVCLSHLYAMGDGADLEIAAKSPGATRLLLSGVIPPLPNNDFPVWRKYEFTLPPGTEQIELHVFSKTDPTGDWIALRDFSFD